MRTAERIGHPGGLQRQHGQSDAPKDRIDPYQPDSARFDQGEGQEREPASDREEVE